jgi:hypothetical protein
MVSRVRARLHVMGIVLESTPQRDAGAGRLRFGAYGA